MKICSYIHNQSLSRQPRLGVIWGNRIIDPSLALACDYEREGLFNPFERAEYKIPTSLSKLLKLIEEPIHALEDGITAYLFLEKININETKEGIPISFKLDDESIRLTKPLDKIGTYRDFYAHEKHVKKGFEKRKEPVPPAWYEMPVYYKGSPNGFIGPEDEIIWPSFSNKLDFELELGVVIGKDGKNIKEINAVDHIFGLTILNDISARDIQKKEMSVRLGPSKGKDFCSVIGPIIVTMDEFDFEEPNLLMQAYINGEKWSEGYSGDAHFNFAQMIAHASKDEWIVAGDFFGSGTVGTGCGLELDKWIKPGDEIELKIEHIGSLKNKVGKKAK